MIRLTRANDVSAWGDKEQTRFALNAICVRVDAEGNGETIATDGGALIKVPCLNGQEEFPVTPGQGSDPAEGEYLMPAKPLAKAIAQAPRKSLKPILMSARFSVDAKGFGIVSTTDLESGRDEKIMPIEGRFPKVDEVWPTGDPVTEVTVDPQYLLELGKYAKAHVGSEKRAVKLTLYGPDKAVRFDLTTEDGREVSGLIMPLTPNK